MGLKPKVKVTGPGAQIINSRLLSWSRIDVSSEQTDQLTLKVDTQGQTGIPKEGAVLTWFEGYDDSENANENLVEKGEFKITRIIPILFPPSITIIATAAPFQIEDKTKFKERKSRSFENITFADLFRQIVTSHGFSPRVANEFEALKLKHVDQNNETDSAFLSRLARERDAVAKPVNALYVLAKKGQIKTITGKAIPAVKVSLPTKNTSASFINCQLDRPSKQSVKGIKANWINTETGKEEEVYIGETPFKKLRQNYPNKTDALQACKDELLKVKRKGTKLKIELPGDPNLVAEGILTLAENFPAGMAGNWSIDKVTAKGDKKGGYRCSIVANLVV